ncbi:MAG: STAS/SEC14 domain-containing protein [Caldilineaceae bacterium]
MVEQYDDHVCVLLDLQEFAGEEVKAWLPDLKFGHRFHDKIAKMAIVGDKRWQRWLTAWPIPSTPTRLILPPRRNRQSLGLAARRRIEPAILDRFSNTARCAGQEVHLNLRATARGRFSLHALVRTAVPKPGRCYRSHEGVRTKQAARVVAPKLIPLANSGAVSGVAIMRVRREPV